MTKMLFVTKVKCKRAPLSRKIKSTLLSIHCGNRGYEKSWSKLSLKVVKCPIHNSKTAVFSICPKKFSRSVINLILLKLAALNSSLYTYMAYLRKP